MGRCVQIICKYYANSYKRIEHLGILVSTGILEPIPTDTEKTLYFLKVIIQIKSLFKKIKILNYILKTKIP